MTLWGHIKSVFWTGHLMGHASEPTSPPAPSARAATEYSTQSYKRGRQFESDVENLIRNTIAQYPSRARLTRQAHTALNDGRSKLLDFVLRYRTISSNHEVGIECQDRERYESSIIDKILATRANSAHNRFWFVYREDSFLSDDATAFLDKHGIMHFSLRQLREHLAAIADELAYAEIDQSRKAAALERPYTAPRDSAQLPRPVSRPFVPPPPPFRY